MKIIRFILTFFLFISFSFGDPLYREDDSSLLAITKRVPNSHINVYIPTMPYIHVASLVNGTLIRATDKGDGWEYMMATSLKREGKLKYTFTLRKNVKFQDGTPFDADSVVENFKQIIDKTYGKLSVKHKIKSVEKLSKYEVLITLNEPFELLFHYLCNMNIYSSAYLKKFSWGEKNSPTANSMKRPGPYGLGPYILKKGFATGREQTPIIELEANPYYYEKGLPYIKKITIYTELSTQQVLEMSLKKESGLDIAPIPFNKKIETLTSPYSKLITMPSKSSISIFMNMIKPKGVLKNQTIRLALNQAINQERLLKFVYKNEGQISSTTSNQNIFSVAKATKDITTHHEALWKSNLKPNIYLKNILNGLKLHVVTMERLMFLWRGIEYQLSLYGVSLDFTIIKSEKELFNLLLTNQAEPKNWDLLSWNNDAWSSNNTWITFFHYRPEHPWSTIGKDKKLSHYMQIYYKTPQHSKDFLQITKKIIHHVYEKAYMLSVPSPNIVLAVNKEVDYTPSKILLMPLWKAKITPYHWSVRDGEYPKKRQIPIDPQGKSNETILEN